MSKTLAAFLTLLLVSVTAFAQMSNLQRDFVRPPDDARIMMRWWWYGPAVTKDEIERELRTMKAGGIGGVEIQPVYALSLDDPSKDIKNLPYLSPEHLDALRFAADKGRELGMRVDLTLGSGWPFGGPTVSIEHAASQLRVERVKVETLAQRIPAPGLGAGEQFIAAFFTKGGKFTEINDIKAGAVTLNGPGEAQFYIASRAGMQVKRPAVGAEGFVLDHLNRAATDDYLKNVGDKLISAFGKNPPYSIFCDSLEVYNQDWSADFLTEFNKRRGYDLKAYLPALLDDSAPKAHEIRYDWGRTLTELLNERFLAPMQAWSRKNRTLFRIQNYGIPPATLSSSAFADLSDGEGAQWRVVRAARWASSASHIYGKNVTASEIWTWLHSPVFRATPLDMKAEADLHFLQGINQFIGHGWPYTPPSVEYPGWRFYAAGVFNENNPWWLAMPDMSLYMQRVSYLMRQGQPANDVALYLSNSDAWANFTPGKVHLIDAQKEQVGPDIMPRIFESGYNLDFFDDGALEQRGRVDKNELALGPNKYRVVILPNVERIPLATLKKLDEFVQNGGILIATKRLPDIAPGLKTTDAERAELRAIAQRLFVGPTAKAHFVIDENAELSGALKGLLTPDLALSPAAPEVAFVHRKTAETDIYFVVNTSNQPQKLATTFRDARGRKPEWWNPMNGQVSEAGAVLELAPYESRVVVFPVKHSVKALPDNPQSAIQTPQSADLSHDWQVTFGADGKPQVLKDLRSWTDEAATRYFSGAAIYEKTVNVPESYVKPDVTVRLDLGEGKPLTPQPLRAGMQTWLDAPVREAAVVYVNDKRAGAVWCPPYSIELSGLLKAGENRLKIVVGNLALNYMAGRKLPDYRLLNLRYGERFQAQDMDKVQIVPAGLLGPITLQAMSNSTSQNK